VQEKKILEKQLEKSMSVIKTLPILQEKLLSNCNLTQELEKSTEVYKQERIDLQQKLEKNEQENQYLKIHISKLVGISRAEKLARESLQQRLYS